MMTDAVDQKTSKAVNELFSDFRKLLTDIHLTDQEMQAIQQRLGQLAILRSVKDFPMRVKCATLGWHALKQAILQLSDKT